jgi:predicted dehydrogenase
MEQVRIGVVGVGRMGQRHCRVLTNLRKSQLVGVYDVNSETGSKVAAQFDIPYYDDLDELLSVVDAVVLASPTPLHFSHAMQAISRGVHVLVEKPITESLGQAEELVKKAEESGLVVQVGHIERFNPVYLELKNIMEEYRPLAITIDRLSPYQGSNKDVDVVLDLMIHDTNLIIDLLGDVPEKIQAQGLTAFSGTVDHAVAQLFFRNGPNVTMTASRITEQKVRKIEAACWETYLEGDLLNKTISAHRSTIGEYINADKRGLKYRQESIVERINVPIFEPLFLELQHFTECVVDCKSSFVSARDGYLALQLATQIRDAILLEMNRFNRSIAAKGEKPVNVTAH